MTDAEAVVSGRMPTVGVNTWVWASPLTDAVLTELAPRVRDWGFDVVELPVEAPGDWDPARAAPLLADLGLGASVALVMAPGRELVATDATTLARTQDYLRGVVDAAHRVGATTVAGPAYASVGRTWRMSGSERRSVYGELVDALGPVVAYAAQAGVTVAVEPLNRYETSVLNTVDQTLEALAPLLSGACGIALDVYHLNIEEQDVPAAVRRAGSAVAHVQVCANDRGAPGADHLDWPGILGAIGDVGYDGPLCIESFTAENDSIATAASIWRPLARTQDAIATDGLAFLRDQYRVPGTEL